MPITSVKTQENNLVHKTVVKAISKCQGLLKRGEKQLRQLSEVAKALEMWDEVNSWDKE